MELLKFIDWIFTFIKDTIILFLWVLAMPFLITVWCFYHPVQAKIYLVHALPLLWCGNWATRGCLVVMILLALLPFEATRPFAGKILKLACLAGLVLYIIAIF